MALLCCTLVPLLPSILHTLSIRQQYQGPQAFASPLLRGQAGREQKIHSGNLLIQLAPLPLSRKRPAGQAPSVCIDRERSSCLKTFEMSLRLIWWSLSYSAQFGTLLA